MNGIRGVDLSRYNYDREVPDFNAVKAAGYEFVILKLTEGVDYIDPYADEMTEGARNAGLRVTYYHFATPGGSRTSTGYKKWWDPIDEAHDFLSALRKDWFKDPDLKDHVKETLGEDPEPLTRWAAQWITEVARDTGYYPMFYTYPSYMNNLVLPNDVLNMCPLWLSHFTNDLDSPPRFKDEWGWKRYEIWQWTSSATVPGLEGDTDDNIAPHGFDELLTSPDCGMSISAQITMHNAEIQKHADMIDKLVQYL
jgi:lysozyme